MIPVLSYPNPRLHKKGQLVEDVNTPEIQKIIDDMITTLYGAKNAAAFAATQLDFKDPKRITVIDLSPEKNDLLVLVNPEILEREGMQYETEGCMSVYPDHIHEKVKRAYRIKVKAQDRTGKPLEFYAEGYLAKCIQHELDHLDGVLYIQHLSSLKFKRIRDQIGKILKAEKKKT